MSDLETFIELVGVQLVWGEDSEGLRVQLDDFGDVGTDPVHHSLVVDKEVCRCNIRFHVGDKLVTVVTECLPIGKVERFERVVSFLMTSQLLSRGSTRDIP